MKKYAQTWRSGTLKPTGNTMEFVEQVGQEAPDYRFDRKLNKKALKGKFVVIHFWSLWCGSCLNLTMDIDSLLFKTMTPYDGVQFIGVDTHEKVPLSEAQKWWEKHGIHYPAVYGDAANACHQAFRGNHPSVFLIDPDGIIRGRWDQRGNSAAMIKLAIWALKIVPEQEIQADLPTVKQLIAEKEYAKALYLLEMMPEHIDYTALTYQCKLVMSPTKAVQHFNMIQEKYRDHERYVDLMEKVARIVQNSESISEQVLKNGIEAIEVVSKSKRDYRIYELQGILYHRYGESLKLKGIDLLKGAIPLAQLQQSSEEEMTRLRELVDRYQMGSRGKLMNREKNEATIHHRLSTRKETPKTHQGQGMKQLEENKQRQQFAENVPSLAEKMVSEPAPDFVLKDSEGKEVKLSDFRGKVVVLDFWATWCGPCKRSFPAMQKAINKYKDDPSVVFLFIHTWEKEKNATEAAAKYLKDNGYTFHLLMDLKDPETGMNKVVTNYNVRGIPAKFVIDPQGNIRFKPERTPKVLKGSMDAQGRIQFEYSNEAENELVEELSQMIEMARQPKK